MNTVDNLILVSVDDHVSEPAGMFDAHVPERYKDQAPRVVTDERGIMRWKYGEIEGRNLGLNAVAGKPPEFFNVDANRYDEMRPGCYDVHERVRDMSAGGVLASMNFPNWTGFAGQVLSQGPDREVNDIMIKAYNDWHVDEWCGAYPDRLIPCGILPLFDPELAAKEVRRLSAKGCHAVTFSENPAALGMSSIHSRAWDPVFAACSDVGTILCTHLGSSSRPLQMSADAPISVGIALGPVRTVGTLLEFLWADIWARFPELRISLTEGDIGWIPYFLHRCEFAYDRHSGWTKHRFPGGLRPIDIFNKHFIVCFIEDPIGLELLKHFDEDNVCWESDYPHADSLWPLGPEALVKDLGDVSGDVVAKITHGNAMRHFQFDPFQHRDPARCTVAALREEAADVDVRTTVGRPADDRDLDAWLDFQVRSGRVQS